MYVMDPMLACGSPQDTNFWGSLASVDPVWGSLPPDEVVKGSLPSVELTTGFPYY